MTARGVIINGPSPHDWLATYVAVALVMLAALPAALLVAQALTRWRRRSGLAVAEARSRSIAEVGLAYGTAPWLWLTMVPASTTPDHRAASLVPLRDLATMPTYQVVGNLLVLAAVGLLGPLRFRALATLPRIVVVCAVASTLIEVTQYALALGRVASVDDVLLNTAGAALAALLSWPLWRQRGALRAA